MTDKEPTKEQVVDVVMGVNNALLNAGLVNSYFQVTINMNDGRIAADFSGDVREANDDPSIEDYFTSHVDYYLANSSVPYWKEYVAAPKTSYMYDDNVSPMENALREANMKKDMLTEYLDHANFGFNFTYSIEYYNGINPTIHMLADVTPSKLQLAKMGIGINNVLCNISDGPEFFNVDVLSSIPYGSQQIRDKMHSRNVEIPYINITGYLSTPVLAPSYRNTPELIAIAMLYGAHPDQSASTEIDNNDTSLVANVLRAQLEHAADPNKKYRENILKGIDKIDDNSSILYAVYADTNIVVMTKTPLSQSEVADLVYRLTMVFEGVDLGYDHLSVDFMDMNIKTYAYIVMPMSEIDYKDPKAIAQTIINWLKFEDKFHDESQMKFLNQMAKDFVVTCSVGATSVNQSASDDSGLAHVKLYVASNEAFITLKTDPHSPDGFSSAQDYLALDGIATIRIIHPYTGEDVVPPMVYRVNASEFTWNSAGIDREYHELVWYFDSQPIFEVVSNLKGILEKSNLDPVNRDVDHVIIKMEFEPSGEVRIFTTSVELYKYARMSNPIP